ncbi:MAG: glucose-6-phosphate dehydrogenase (coenzyme-F420) [Pseudomonadota bacterium]
MLRLGYKASTEQFSPQQLIQFAVAAEAHGFDSVFVSDHFQPWRHTDGHAPSAIALLGALGASTSRITIGTSVLTPTFRYHPAIVAQAFATLGSLFPGRMILGVGSGESLNEVPATKLSWPDNKVRFARLREAVELIRQLWREQRVSFNGEYYQTQNATIYDRPAQPIPVYIAAAGPKIAAYAGQYGDGFICTSGKAETLYTEQLLPQVMAGRARRPDSCESSFENMIELKVSFNTDQHQALQDTRHWAALALSPEQKMNMADPLDLERLAAALPLEQVASRWIVSTDPDEHVAQISRYIRLGFRHLVFHAPGNDQLRFMQHYAEHILPRLRSGAR